jgi:hypothetical protein
MCGKTVISRSGNSGSVRRLVAGPAPPSFLKNMAFRWVSGGYPPSTTLSDHRYQIDHRSGHKATQAFDRTGTIAYRRSQQGMRLAAVPIRIVYRGGLAASFRAS